MSNMLAPPIRLGLSEIRCIVKVSPLLRRLCSFFYLISRQMYKECIVEIVIDQMLVGKVFLTKADDPDRNNC